MTNRDVILLAKKGIVKRRGNMIGIFAIAFLCAVAFMSLFFYHQTFNQAVNHTLEKTDHRILVKTQVDEKACGDACDYQKREAEIKSMIEAYGGEVLMARNFQLIDTNFIILERPNETKTKVCSMYILDRDFLQLKSTSIVTLNDKQSTIKLNNDLECQLKILFSEDKSHKQNNTNNFKNLFFVNLRNQNNYNFLYVSPDVETQIYTNNNQNGVAVNGIIAQFRDLPAASRYFKDEKNYCSSQDQIFNRCPAAYINNTSSLAGSLVENFNAKNQPNIVVDVSFFILIISALVVLTFMLIKLRLDENKIIELYKRLGANKKQLFSIYTLRSCFFILSIFIVTAGLILFIGAPIYFFSGSFWDFKL